MNDNNPNPRLNLNKQLISILKPNNQYQELKFNLIFLYPLLLSHQLTKPPFTVLNHKNKIQKLTHQPQNTPKSS